MSESALTVSVAASAINFAVARVLIAAGREHRSLVLEADGRHVQFHALRTRSAGARAFVSVHVLVPGDWRVQRGHDLVERIEHDLRAALQHATVFTHLEPLEDPASFADTDLDRRGEES